jgi:hypothetical protein
MMTNDDDVGFAWSGRRGERSELGGGRQSIAKFRSTDMAWSGRRRAVDEAERSDTASDEEVEMAFRILRRS